MKFAARFYHHDNVVRREVKRMNRKVLRRCGAYVRKIARDFVKHVSNPDKHSEQLHSPFDHYGLKKSIVFASDENAAYIGPRYIKGGLANVARLHEFGGSRIVKDIDFQKMRSVKIGDEAPVRKRFVSKSDSVIRKGGTDPKTGQPVFWIKIRTKSQAEHATRVYRRTAPKNAGSVLAKYAPRPYMIPALKKSLPYLPALWRNAMSKN